MSTATVPATVLFVDDCEDDIELYSRYIKKDSEYSWDVEVAETGEEALAKFQSNKILCVLLDYSLPGSDGIATLEKIREIDPHAPIIMLTGQGSESVAVKALQGGAQDYLAKNTLTPEELTKAIHEAINRSLLVKKIDEQKEELEDFARILAHDLRQPVRHIVQLSELLVQGEEDQLSASGQRYVELMCNTAQRLQNLINAISTYTRLDTRSPEFADVDVGEIVASAEANLAELISERRAHIDYKKLPWVHGQSAQLIQLFQNLISNAIKYCPKHRPNISITANASRFGWEFTVADNGIGIDEAYFERIFQPLRRLHGADEFEGTGLGLATCKKIIKRHHGEIWCTSKLGTGSNFHFTISAHQAAD